MTPAQVELAAIGFIFWLLRSPDLVGTAVALALNGGF